MTDIAPLKTYRDRARETPVVTAYISEDDHHVTTWDGKIIGRVRESRVVPLAQWSHTWGRYMTWYRVLMDDGVMRWGRSGSSMVVVLRAYTDQDKFNAR
jgi:hypothetical protein